MSEPRLSVLIVARNEGANLRDCLESARFADERVVVVDAASQDDTLEIARGHADVVAVRVFEDFATQRNAALGIAAGDWVLSIDADERVTPELAAEIRQRLRGSVESGQVGFQIPIRSEILGRPFSHSGTQQDLPLRLFRRDLGHWKGQVHETVAIAGTVGRTTHAIEHRTLPSVQVFLEKIDHYTTLEASDLYESGRRFRASDLAVRPFWTFLKLYLAKQGFRDGLEGLMFCALSGLSVAIRTWKLRELEWFSNNLLTVSLPPPPTPPLQGGESSATQRLSPSFAMHTAPSPTPLLQGGESQATQRFFPPLQRGEKGGWFEGPWLPQGSSSSQGRTALDLGRGGT